MQGDVLSDDISFTLKGSSAVISCIGVIGGTYDVMEKGNGSVNAAAVEKSRAAGKQPALPRHNPCIPLLHSGNDITSGGDVGVPKFVYVSVASIVPDSVSGIVGSTDFKVWTITRCKDDVRRGVDCL